MILERYKKLKEKIIKFLIFSTIFTPLVFLILFGCIIVWYLTPSNLKEANDYVVQENNKCYEPISMYEHRGMFCDNARQIFYNEAKKIYSKSGKAQYIAAELYKNKISCDEFNDYDFKCQALIYLVNSINPEATKYTAYYILYYYENQMDLIKQSEENNKQNIAKKELDIKIESYLLNIPN